jgi:hypothetical protein
MTTSRRKFLEVGLLTAVFAATSVKSVFGQSFKTTDGNPLDALQSGDNLANYTKATFKSYLNSVFELRSSKGNVGLTLQKVEDLSAPKGGEAFSLLFRGGSEELKQDTYTLVHPSLGTIQLFLVPAGTDQNGAQGYLAVLNRLSLADAQRPAPTRKYKGWATPESKSAPPAVDKPVVPDNAPEAKPEAAPKPAKKKPSISDLDN